MVALRTIDIRNDFKKVSELVRSGEKILIARPHNENLVIISEKEYNELDKARHNAEYYARIDSAIERVAKGRVVVKSMDELEELAR